MMKYFQQLQTGIYSYFTAVLMLGRSTMWMAFAVPLFLAFGLQWAGEAMADSLDGVRFARIHEDDGTQYMLIGLKSIAVYLAVYMNKYMVITLLAPLLTALSTRTEFLLTGNRYKYDLAQYITDVQRALVISFRNMGILTGWMLLFYILTYALDWPYVLTDIAYYLVAFYFYGFSFMDYASERRRLTVSESVTFTRQHFPAAYALGAIYGGLFFIPYAGVVVAPILGVVAGTIAVHELVDLRKNPFAIRPEEAGMPATTGDALVIGEEVVAEGEMAAAEGKVPGDDNGI